METKLNIAEILKDKPNGLRLYSPIFGDCTFCYVREDTNDICVKKRNGVIEYFNSEGLYFALGEVMLFPSKEMRDWSKFFKKGDVLICYEGKKPYYTIFDGFENNTYRAFKGKFAHDCYEDKWYQNEGNLSTSTFHKLNRADSEIYIKKIEEHFGGKLNLETLEIEKAQPEFKDGDIVSAVFTDDDEMVCVFKEKIEQDYMGYCGFFSKGKHKGDVIMDLGDDCIYNDSPICKEIRLATEEEKQQLFSALEKERKRWDSDKKAIVDLKPKVELKPFDKVLVRDSKSDYWRATLFSHINENGCYYCVWAGWTYCIPYEGNEHLLGTNKDVEG